MQTPPNHYYHHHHHHHHHLYHSPFPSPSAPASSFNLHPEPASYQSAMAAFLPLPSSASLGETFRPNTSPPPSLSPSPLPLPLSRQPEV